MVAAHTFRGEKYLMVKSQWSALLEALIPLLFIATIALLVTILALAHAVFIPVALAIMLTFILTPGVKALERLSLPRVGAVAVVMVLTLGVVGGFGYVLSRQFNDLAAQIPQYSKTIKQKFATLRASRKGAIADMQKTVEEVSHELDKQEEKAEQKGNKKTDEKTLTVKQNVQPVLVVPSEPTDVERFWGMVAPIFEPLATVGIVLILTIFMLIQREDLRNRFLAADGPRKDHVDDPNDGRGGAADQPLFAHSVPHQQWVWNPCGSSLVLDRLALCHPVGSYGCSAALCALYRVAVSHAAAHGVGIRAV